MMLDRMNERNESSKLNFRSIYTEGELLCREVLLVNGLK
jgi:hypothetical protein